MGGVHPKNLCEPDCEERQRWRRAGQPYCRSSRTSTPAEPSSPRSRSLRRSCAPADGHWCWRSRAAGWRCESPTPAARSCRSQPPPRTRSRCCRNAAAIARLIAEETVDLVHARSRAPAWSALRGGATGAGAVRHDLSWGLRRDQRGEAALQQRDGARRRRHRQLALHGRSDRPALRHRSRPHGGDPPRRRSRRVRSRSHCARAGCRLARHAGA